jgi:hypothetical protein
MKSLAIIFVALYSLRALAVTTVTISNTVAASNIDRPGINLGGVAYYGSQQLYKSLNYASGGYMSAQYFATAFSCSSGGTQTTTSWYNNITNGTGFPANFWAGASYVAINASTGTSYGSGTVTASTSNVSSGANFTLSPAMSSACSPSNNDVLIVRLDSQNTLEPPNFYERVCSGATWNTSDTSPSSTNTYQSLEMPTSCTLTFYTDAVFANTTNTNGFASSNVNFINLNGSYNATFKAKCAVSGCSLNFNLVRLGGTTFVGSTTVNPSFSATPGVGWTTYNYPFTGTETGSQSSNISYVFTCTGSCLIQDADIVEGSTLAGNTTVFRDAVVWELEQLHPGSIRYMDTSQWCSDVADEIAAVGDRRWCGASAYLPQIAGTPIGYNDVLALGNVIGSDVFLSVGQLNGPSDWTTLVNWLSSSGWISTYASSGHKIYLEDGNEAWNAVPASIWNGDGIAYGYTLGLNMAAAKAAFGYNSSVIKLVGDGWIAANQGYGPFGWINNTLTTAHTTASTGLPDFIDNAPYMLNYLGAFNTSGSNVASTGAPFLDEWAEDTNLDSVTSPPTNATSMYENTQYAKTNFSVGTAVYEVNESTLSGITASQLQLNQINGSVGNALSTLEHVLLMQRDSGVTGPIHVFTLPNPYSSYACSGCGTLDTPLWGANLFMATGPGQTAGAANADRPLNIALNVINNAIGSNINLMTVTQVGTPTFSYTADQDSSGTPTILANSAVPYVNCFAYSNGSLSWTTICFNNNLTTAESVTLAGAGTPTGPVTETIFPKSANAITDNNENTFLGTGSVAAVVILPTATSTSGVTYSIPPASFVTLTYSTSSTVFVSQAGGSVNCGADGTQATESIATFNSTTPTAGNIYKGCGTFTAEAIVSGPGTSGNPVTWKGESNCVFTSAAWNTTAFSSGGNNYVTLNGCTFQNTNNGTTGAFSNSLASIGIDFSGSSNSEIENVTVSNIYVRTGNSTTDNSAGASGNRCIKWSGGSNNTITNNTTHDCRYNIYSGGTTESNITISFNTAYNQAAFWWVAPGNTGSTLTNVVVNNNTFHDPAPAWDSSPSDYFHIDGIHYFCQATSTCSGFYCYNNYFYGSFGVDYTAQIFTETDTGTNAVEEVYNNLIVNTTTTQSANGAIDLQTGANGLIANNTVIGSGTGTGVGINIISGTNITQKNNLVENWDYMEATSSGVTFATSGLNNNLYYNSSNWFQYQGTGEGSLAAWQSASGQDGSAVSANPTLNGSYQPNSGSPAIAAGANLTSLSITPLDSDLNNNGRPNSGAWTIGALNAIVASSAQVHQSDSW